jgi:AmiR/NasT family two-component response regulator
MESALIIASSQKHIAYFTEILSAASIRKIVTLPTCGEARRLLVTQDFDLVIINAPLSDETGENLSRQIASKGMAQVILVVASEYFDAVSALCENDGVLTISKPIHREVFWSALMLARAAQKRLAYMQAENRKLKQKIEDIRIVDRAKCILISYMSMSEQEAHRYIEKQAMDMRVSRREIAEGILKTYEN